MNLKEERRIKKQIEFDASHNQAERNKNGQFATPIQLAKAISADAIKRVDHPKLFLEPACGTGAFISAVKEIDPEIEIDAVEKDLELFKIANSIWSDSKTNIYNEDFFDFATTEKRYDLLIANPPYSRHHHLDQTKKQKYGNLIKESVNYRLSQLSGLHAYFILGATNLLNPGGVASWLIPAELFSVNYGKVVRNYITKNVTVERIHFFEKTDLQFEDALVSSCVLTIRNKEADDQYQVVITRGDFSKPRDEITMTIAELRATEKWQHIFHKTSHSSHSKIGDYFNVKRGLSTGSESFYSKKRSEWQNIGIEDEWLIPVLPAPRYVKDLLIISDELGWPLKYEQALLKIPSSLDEVSLPGALQEYLSNCPDKIRNSYTATHRKKWFSIEQRDPAPIVCTYMSRSDSQPFRFIRNKTNAVVTTAYLCLYPVNNQMSEDDLDQLCDKLNAIDPNILIKASREYGGGLRKLEPKELLSIPF